MPLIRDHSKFNELEKILFKTITHKGGDEIIRTMYSIYSVAYEIGIPDLHMINAILAAGVMRVEVVLILDEAKKSRQEGVSDRDLYNIAVDQAADMAKDLLKQDKQYKGYKSLEAELVASLERLKREL